MAPVQPATLGDLTIGELFQILNQVQQHPYKEKHSFIFGWKRLQVTVYQDTEEGIYDKNEINNPDEF